MIFKNILFTMFWKQQNGRVRYSVLPPGFIESDGVFDAPSGYKPYVNTGLLLSPSTQKKWTIEFSYHGCTNPANIAVMGTSYSKTSGNYALWVDNSDGTNGRKIEFIFGNGNAGRQELAQYKYDKNVLITENRHKYEMNLLTGQGFIDDVCVITAGAVASVPNPTPVVFHAVWRGSSVFNTGAGTIHSLKIGDPSDGGAVFPAPGADLHVPSGSAGGGSEGPGRPEDPAGRGIPEDHRGILCAPSAPALSPFLRISS